MRIYLKKRIYDMLVSLAQAEEQLKHTIDSEENDPILQLLEDSQQAAIAIGNVIETCETENAQSIKLLEQYCELLWEYSQTISCKKRLFQIHKKLRRIRIQLENIIRYDIPDDQLEIVFLPYKADMWTSLHTIWKAFSNDSICCNTYVVALPYFDIGDSTHIKLMYEGNRFPDEVPIVDYQSYNLEKHHPDMIFIHNPYDDQNNLTRLPENYFSVNLNKNTELLVYSPYFTIGTYQKGKQDFMFMAPGAMHCDFIIAQSQYVKLLFENYGYPSKKILAFGSPKIDIIVKNRDQKVEIPHEWKDKIKNRKVFLLNTHLSYFPKSFSNQSSSGNYGMKFHQEILETFLDRNDCTLIWRPHPLLENMLSDRFPECMEFYKYLIGRISESSNGIIDRSGDYTTSFYCSHALLSTWSSLVNEYMVTGKPVLIFQRRMDSATAATAPLNRNTNYFRFGKSGITFPEFRDLILSGEDPLCEKRMRAVQKAFPNLDGCAGEQIHKYLINYIRNGE